MRNYLIFSAEGSKKAQNNYKNLSTLLLRVHFINTPMFVIESCSTLFSHFISVVG